MRAPQLSTPLAVAVGQGRVFVADSSGVRMLTVLNGVSSLVQVREGHGASKTEMRPRQRRALPQRRALARDAPLPV